MIARAVISSRSPLMRLLTAGCLGLPAIVTRAQEGELDVGVRTTIVDKSLMPPGKTSGPGDGGHPRTYGIYSVQLIRSDQKLVKPVDDTAILQLLSVELNKNGFHLYRPGQHPKILLTVSYGRGEVRNPYFRDQGETGGDSRAGAAGGFANDSGATTSVINGAFAQQYLDQKSTGYESKLQKAAQEKLYIRVTAWEYPDGPNARSKMLWKTIMVVDDPDHRDLNKIAEKMLEAGAPYFDKQIKDPEVDVSKPLPDTHVNVGAPEVVPAKGK